MSRRALTIFVDADREHCGPCAERYVYGPESDGNACHRFPGRIFGRDGFKRLEACKEAELATKREALRVHAELTPREG